MKITGTFLDEISHDIPHHNWGEKEWDKDFAAMKAIDIDTVILIRCGHKRWMTYPSQILQQQEGGYLPPVDLVDMFLRLGEKYGLGFYFGGYDSGKYWANGQFDQEVDINLAVFDEAWVRYGKSPAFKGWYLSQEVSRKIGGISTLRTSICGTAHLHCYHDSTFSLQGNPVHSPLPCSYAARTLTSTSTRAPSRLITVISRSTVKRPRSAFRIREKSAAAIPVSA